MVPFAGRVRNGQINQLLPTQRLPTLLPPTAGPHATHGYGYASPWEIVGDQASNQRCELRFDFAEPWPWRGSATQRFALTNKSLTITMHIHATDEQPMQLGWHPWFQRDIGNGHSAELDFSPTAMFERDPSGIPTGRRITPPDGPWDDCFTGLETNPVIRWGDLHLELSATATEWTVYDEPEHTLCVEPQTGPPNQINDAPRMIKAGQSMIENFTLTVR